MSTPRITLISVKGSIGAGKTTVADALHLHHGFQVVPLADPLKGALGDLGGQSRWLDKTLAEIGLSHRTSWQILGNECRYDLAAALGLAGEPWDAYAETLVQGPALAWTYVLLIKVRFLTRYLAGRAAAPDPTWFRFVVPDLRHPEEDALLRQAITAWGGRYACWEVTRPGAGGGAADTHSSERLARAIRADAMIANDGTLERLIHQVVNLGRLYLTESGPPGWRDPVPKEAP